LPVEKSKSVGAGIVDRPKSKSHLRPRGLLGRRDLKDFNPATQNQVHRPFGYALRQYSDAIAKARNRKMRRQLWDDLLFNLAWDLVRHRPNRTEPRAVKRRPKRWGFALLGQRIQGTRVG
jgi:hypothetical protein